MFSVEDIEAIEIIIRNDSEEVKRNEKLEIIFPLIGIVFLILFIITMCIKEVRSVGSSLLIIAFSLNLLGVFYYTGVK